MSVCLFFSCPFDYVKVYDGYTNEAEVIGIYCGKHRDIELFSTTAEMRIEFRTKSGRVEPTKKSYVTYWEIEEDNQRKGFMAEFEISYNFVNLGKTVIYQTILIIYCLMADITKLVRNDKGASVTVG